MRARIVFLSGEWLDQEMSVMKRVLVVLAVVLVVCLWVGGVGGSISTEDGYISLKRNTMTPLSNRHSCQTPQFLQEK